MHYVYLENNIVVDQAQIDPYKVFYPEYASKFIEAPDEVTHFWRLENGVWLAPQINYVEQNKIQAMKLLQATDWVELPSVSNTSLTPHLTNFDEFITYRTALRVIAVNPPSEEIIFPNKPNEIWSN